ncbi:MAG: response regulator, partial [Gemmatimonadaceae bacterium]
MMETELLATAPFRSPLHATAAQRRTAEPTQPRVLVVDDEEAIRTAIARYLRTQGYEVEVVESGAAALAMLTRQRFVVMLCDVRMPQMTGLDVLPEALHLDT